jgi:zinc/manganese transport system permease protein
LTLADLTILGPAALTGFLVLATHVPLGRIVLDRGIVFIDLAIAQIAGLGVVAANAAGWEAHGWPGQVAAFTAALAAAGIMARVEKRMKRRQEALIGVLFVTAASLEIILLAFSAHGADHLKDMLVGQILWVSWPDLAPLVLLCVVIVGTTRRLNLRQRPMLFHVLFALTVTVSVQLIGIFLVFASLVVPALAATGVARWPFVAFGVGIAGYASGLLSSMTLDLPTGAAIVCALAGSAAIVALCRLVMDGKAA